MTARVSVVGLGAVGARVARRLSSLPDLAELSLIDVDERRARQVLESLGSDRAHAGEPSQAPAVVVLCQPGPHAQAARSALSSRSSVVSTTCSGDAVREMRPLDTEARAVGKSVVVGVGMIGGLDVILSRHGASTLDDVEEVHISQSGGGGCSCRRELRALARQASADWRDGSWVTVGARRGRRWSWFPEPLGARECRAADLASPALCRDALPGLRRASVRVARPGWLGSGDEEALGGLVVEVRGRRGPAQETIVLGLVGRPAVVTAAVAATTASWVLRGSLRGHGVAGVASLLSDPVPFLRELADRGVRAARLEPADVGRRLAIPSQ